MQSCQFGLTCTGLTSLESTSSLESVDWRACFLTLLPGARSRAICYLQSCAKSVNGGSIYEHRSRRHLAVSGHHIKGTRSFVDQCENKCPCDFCIGGIKLHRLAASSSTSSIIGWDFTTRGGKILPPHGHATSDHKCEFRNIE